MKLLIPMMPLVLISGRVHAQPTAETHSEAASQLVNLEATQVMERGASGGRIDVRAFGGREALAYTSVGARIGVGSGWEGVIRGSFADRKTLALASGATIRHGGSDVEVVAKRSSEAIRSRSISVAGLAGLSFPGTPAQKGSIFTLG